MKTLSCKDLGMKDEFTATGETDAEVKKKMLEHAKVAHRDMMNNMTQDQMKEMDKKMDSILAMQK